MKWIVWITGYPGSYSTVEAPDVDRALVLGARQQRASHHGETVTVNAREAGDDYNGIYSRDASITSYGILWRGSLDSRPRPNPRGAS